MQQLSLNTTKLYSLTLRGFLAILPVIWLPGINQRDLQFLVFSYGAVVLFFLGMGSCHKRKFGNYVLPILGGIGIFLSLAKNQTGISMSLINLIFGGMIYHSMVENVEDVGSILKVFMGVVILNLIMFSIQVCGIDPIYVHNGDCIDKMHFSKCGLMSRNYHLAFLLAMMSPLGLLSRRWRIPFLLIIGAVLVCIKSYAAILAFVFGILVYLFLSSRNLLNKIKVSVVGLSVLVGGGIFLGKDLLHKITPRIQVWEDVLREGFANPFIGLGLGVPIEETFISNIAGNLGSSFNEVINLMLQMGLVPFGVFIYFTVRYLKGIFPRRMSRTTKAIVSSTLAILPIAMFHEVLHAPRLAVIVLAMVALLEISLIKDKEEGYVSESQV